MAVWPVYDIFVDRQRTPATYRERGGLCVEINRQGSRCGGFVTIALLRGDLDAQGEGRGRPFRAHNLKTDGIGLGEFPVSIAEKRAIVEA